MGNRTVHLKVIAEWEQIGSIMHEKEMVQKTGDFTTALELLGNYETCILKTELAICVQIESSFNLIIQLKHCFTCKNWSTLFNEVFTLKNGLCGFLVQKKWGNGGKYIKPSGFFSSTKSFTVFCKSLTYT